VVEKWALYLIDTGIQTVIVNYRVHTYIYTDCCDVVTIKRGQLSQFMLFQIGINFRSFHFSTIARLTASFKRIQMLVFRTHIDCVQRRG
jgi:hypothetical protein